MNRLSAQVLSPASQAAYRRSWVRLEGFNRRVGLPLTFPVPVSTVALFVADLAEQGYAAATVASDLSAIAFVHKMLDVVNPCEAFVVTSLLRSMRRRTVPDSRAPVSVELLRDMVKRLYLQEGMSYDFVLYRAVFTVAFYGFCRIGELAVSGSADHRLRMEDLTVRENEIEVTFHTFKHSAGMARVVLQASAEVCCPVRAVKEYLMLRPAGLGPLFIAACGASIKREQVVAVLKRLALACGSSGRYDGHSFRIGATTHAAQQGRSASDIKRLGRWSSDAYLRYVRGVSL